MKRPGYPNSSHTTPNSVNMCALLGAGCVAGPVTLTRSEFKAVNQLYGFVREKPNDRPAVPVAPTPLQAGASYEQRRAYQDDLAKHERAVNAHARWQDPRVFLQAGADRNAIRQAESDGLRILAWLAKHVEPGEDPLKLVIRMAIEFGLEVEAPDVDWCGYGDEAEHET